MQVKQVFSNGSVDVKNFTFKFGSLNDCQRITYDTNSTDNIIQNFIYNEQGVLEKAFAQNNRVYYFWLESGLVTKREEAGFPADLGEDVMARNIYIYNADKQLTGIDFYVRQPTSVDLVLLQRYVYEYDGHGNIVKLNYINPGSPQNNSYTLYTHDDKVNPYHNFEPKVNISAYNPYNKNNILTQKTYRASDPSTVLNEITYSYQYDEGGYPTYSLTTSSGSSPLQTYFTYQH
ncbi:hypothetical protein [Flavobacterium caeni]|nr:hypothetical protein [Flavobacterium caeni]